MGNLLQYTNKSETIDNKLSVLLAQIQHDYNEGKIRTETEYYYRIKNMLNEFYDSLTKPTFKYRPAVSTPISSEYNAMITESYNDMQYIIKDCEALGNLVSQSFVDAELGRTMMTNELAYLSKKVQTIGESIARNQPQGVVVFTELFNNFELFGNPNSPNSAYVNTQSGILTLKQSSTSKPLIKRIEIDDEFSNGFPGNTHCVDTLNNELHFIGQDGLHSDVGYIIDGYDDTWFEFELFSITDDTRRECNSYGFEYDEGVSWVNNDDILRLKLIVHLSEISKCSWVTLKPYLSDEKGVKNCYLEKAEVITSSNNVYQVASNKIFNDILVFPFPPQEIKQIELTFMQPAKYLTKIGHFYYTSVDTSDMSIFQEYDYSDVFARVDGKKPSVGLLGCKYNPSTQWITYPSSKTELLEPAYIKSKLFALPESTIAVKSNQEILEAYRYMIGIRELSVSTSTFAKYGEYVSNVFTTEEVITSVTLETEEYIPGGNAEILKYYISLNGGTTWHQIYPMHRAYQGIYKYYINNNTLENLLAEDTTDKKSKNLSIIGDPKSIQIKIELNRPTGIEAEEYNTPIVYHYKLRLTTGGETIEY